MVLFYGPERPCPCSLHTCVQALATSSHDKLIFLWRTYGDCKNYMLLQVRGFRASGFGVLIPS
jgi:hypothetical protein